MTLRQVSALVHPRELETWQALYLAEANEQREAQRRADAKSKGGWQVG